MIQKPVELSNCFDVFIHEPNNSFNNCNRKIKKLIL